MSETDAGNYDIKKDDFYSDEKAEKINKVILRLQLKAKFARNNLVSKISHKLQTDWVTTTTLEKYYVSTKAMNTRPVLIP